jgi:hypothetical protein
MPKFHLAPTLSHDGLTIDDGQIVIHQRTLGKGDISIRPSDVTEVRASHSQGDLPFLQGSINLRVGGKKYVLRRLPKKDRDAAMIALQEAIASP